LKRLNACIGARQETAPWEKKKMLRTQSEYHLQRDSTTLLDKKSAPFSQCWGKRGKGKNGRGGRGAKRLNIKHNRRSKS